MATPWGSVTPKIRKFEISAIIGPRPRRGDVLRIHGILATPYATSHISVLCEISNFREAVNPKIGKSENNPTPQPLRVDVLRINGILGVH